MAHFRKPIFDLCMTVPVFTLKFRRRDPHR